MGKTIRPSVLLPCGGVPARDAGCGGEAAAGSCCGSRERGRPLLPFPLAPSESGTARLPLNVSFPFG